MNEKNIKLLLKGLGLDSILAEIEKDDFDTAKAIADYNASQKAHYHDIVKNEISGEIENEVTAKVEGKLYNTLRNDLKKTFGIPIEKLKDQFPNEMLKIVKAHVDETTSKGSGSEDVKKLQEEKIEWQNKHAELEQTLVAKVEAASKEADKRVVAKLTDLSFVKTFHEIPADKIVGGHADVTLLGLKSYMSNKYDFGLDDKEATIPYEKGTSKRVTLRDAGGKEYFATVPELMLNSLKETKGLKESNGGEGSGNQGRGGNGMNGSNGQQKSQRMIELEQKAKAAA